MHTHSLLLHGGEHLGLFHGVVWTDGDAASLECTKGKIQEMLDACYELAEGQCGGNRRQADELVDRLIDNWQRTGMVE